MQSIRPMKVRTVPVRNPDVLEFDGHLTPDEVQKLKSAWFTLTGRRPIIMDGGLRLRR